MTTKLTLSIEEGIIKHAKKYAEKKGRSLSEIIQSYLEALTLNRKEEKEISPKIKKLLGAVKLPKDADYKKILAEELSKKRNK
jgi:alkyl hydroperoxide reductase subunit AhpC